MPVELAVFFRNSICLVIIKMYEKLNFVNLLFLSDEFTISGNGFSYFLKRVQVLTSLGFMLS